MTDREMLEFAAKAFGGVSYVDGMGWIHEDDDGERGAWWNPLEDDGDALRLAVKLGIRFHRVGHKVHAIGLEQVEEYCDEDQDKAARQAITRAAAEIGKRMP